MIEVNLERFPEKEIQFPILMESQDNTSVVLFVSDTVGYRFKPYMGDNIEDNWRPIQSGYWKLFNGVIKLSNA